MGRIVVQGQNNQSKMEWRSNLSEIECLLCKGKAPSSNPSPAKKKGNRIAGRTPEGHRHSGHCWRVKARGRTPDMTSVHQEAEEWCLLASHSCDQST
jgi:hypothetical protein